MYLLLIPFFCHPMLIIHLFSGFIKGGQRTKSRIIGDFSTLIILVGYFCLSFNYSSPVCCTKYFSSTYFCNFISPLPPFILGFTVQYSTFVLLDFIAGFVFLILSRCITNQMPPIVFVPFITILAFLEIYVILLSVYAPYMLAIIFSVLCPAILYAFITVWWNMNELMLVIKSFFHLGGNFMEGQASDILREAQTNLQKVNTILDKVPGSIDNINEAMRESTQAIIRGQRFVNKLEIGTVELGSDVINLLYNLRENSKQLAMFIETSRAAVQINGWALAEQIAEVGTNASRASQAFENSANRAKINVNLGEVKTGLLSGLSRGLVDIVQSRF